MAKNIVLCSDGTGSSGIQKRGTNVFKLYEAVDLHGHKINPAFSQQIAFYDDGVGTESLKPLKILGGAFGWGLSRNVIQLYANLVRTYEKGDRIYLFGFSRGAYTVRTLAGFIMTCGIINREPLATDEELLENVKWAYNRYRTKYRTVFGKCFRRRYNEDWIIEFRKEHCVVDEQSDKPSGEVPIEFIGVWDTVDAVGVPIDELAYVIDKFIYPFRFVDYKLSKKEKLKKACHALSIDDERLTFHPVMWDEEGEDDGRIEQVWFAGVHSNVGGGYSRHGMSLVSLDWMMSKAEQAGLRLNPEERLRFIKHDRELYHEHKNITDKLYNSRSGMGVFYRYKPRNIGDSCKKNHTDPKIHDSVIERILQGSEGYAPGNIPFNCKFVSTGNNSNTYVQFEKEFNHVFVPGNESLLNRAKWWIRIRRWSYYAFLFTTIIAIYVILSAEISNSGLKNTFVNLMKGTNVIQFTKHLLAKPCIPVFIVIFLAIGYWARKKTNKVYSRFWHTHLQKLQTIMSHPDSIDEKKGNGQFG